ncbi:Transcriptional regulator, AbiEi antitoxin, Type IV TA system [Geodermatophilus telluris]|uniref:Transcriptional regulator, AbiEi antitoxin, Type IV TA system n=1 Tax=Geodermatophilus telluris TaxID=1190417 RepID=A0A1G6M612_9ACTN|nr:hypothetical protein [Geodermatophilus telluris]SDC50871.1 Transcriptional regulator, AbiEi antitoxin, Type IV TA system [Geodermatophilus telluris]
MPELPSRLVLRTDALQEGFSDDEIGRLTRRRDWVRLRRGAYLDGPAPENGAVRHRLLVRATLAALRRPAVVSHQSAAVLLGLPLWSVPLQRVHVTRRPPAWNDASRALVVHVGELDDDEVVHVGGTPVTAPARTAVDLARALPFERAVVVLDAALHDGVCSETALAAAVERAGGRPGVRAASRAVAFADGRSESVGESRSRVLLHRLGLSPTGLQFPVHAADGPLLGRADFVWEDRRVVGEFDGAVKYGRLLRPGQHPGDVVFEEKRREDAIRDERWGVTRWTWDDLAAPARLGARVRRALVRGG